LKTARRYRPTFLLQVVVLCGSVGVFAGLVALTPLTLPTVAILLVIWVVALELGLLPWALERWLADRAEAGTRPPASVWFVDRRAEERRAREDRSSEVRDNPVLW
jgi:hypothetical protein